MSDDTVDIVKVVSAYVPGLTSSGRLRKGTCPFHDQAALRPPDFVVDPERGTWHCFGECDAGGDVLDFVQRVVARK